MDVLARHGVGKRQHRNLVPNFLEARGRGRADFPGGTVGPDQVGEPRLDGLIPPPQCIVLGIADLRLVLCVVEPIVVGNEPGQLLQLRTGLVLGQFFRRSVKKSRAIPCHSLTCNHSEDRAPGPAGGFPAESLAASQTIK